MSRLVSTIPISLLYFYYTFRAISKNLGVLNEVGVYSLLRYDVKSAKYLHTSRYPDEKHETNIDNYN